MAIDNMQGKVSTTGMMNNMPAMPKGDVNPQIPQEPETKQAVAPAEQNIEKQNTTAFQGTTNLTDEDMETINAALSPSVKTALGKVFPDLKSVIDQLGTNEPNVIIPLSVAKRYAASKYGGENESDALTNFMTDMMSPEINAAGNNQMETQQTNVPPGNEPQGLMTSPQNMETV